MGWEEVEVQGGKFKTVRLEYKIKNITPGGFWYGAESSIRYWFSPDAKYFVKCEYDKQNYPGVQDWELTSFRSKK